MPVLYLLDEIMPGHISRPTIKSTPQKGSGHFYYFESNGINCLLSAQRVIYKGCGLKLGVIIIIIVSAQNASSYQFHLLSGTGLYIERNSKLNREPLPRHMFPNSAVPSVGGME